MAITETLHIVELTRQNLLNVKTSTLYAIIRYRRIIMYRSPLHSIQVIMDFDQLIKLYHSSASAVIHVCQHVAYHRRFKIISMAWCKTAVSPVR